jgi:hypothetical protein
VNMVPPSPIITSTQPVTTSLSGRIIGEPGGRSRCHPEDVVVEAPPSLSLFDHAVDGIISQSRAFGVMSTYQTGLTPTSRPHVFVKATPYGAKLICRPSMSSHIIQVCSNGVPIYPYVVVLRTHDGSGALQARRTSVV